MNLCKQTKKKTITTGGFVHLSCQFSLWKKAKFAEEGNKTNEKKTPKQAEVFEERVQIKVQHEIRSQQALNTRIIQ